MACVFFLRTNRIRMGVWVRIFAKSSVTIARLPQQNSNKQGENKIRSKQKRKKITLKWGKKWARSYETNAHNVKWAIFFAHSLIWLKPKQSNVKNIAGGYWRVSLIMWLKLVMCYTFENHLHWRFHVYTYFIKSTQFR